MTTAHADFGIWKRIRPLVIALGCSVAVAAVAADAPPLGDTPTPGRALPGSVLAPAAVRGNREGTRVGCGAGGVALQVLGSGGPELQDKRASTSYLVWRGGIPRVLVDSGGGSALRFGESGATMSDLDVILLTHLHVDHTADLTALVKSSFFEERHRTLPIYGPDGNRIFPSTTRFIKTLFGNPNGAYAYLSDFVTPGAADSYPLEAHDVDPGAQDVRQIYSAQGTRIFATRVVHGGVPALAYRVEMDNVSIAFSGDTDGNNGNLERLARNVNLFVAHNAVPEGATGVERSLHMPPSVIGKIASAAAVKQLVLSHRMLRTLGHESESLTAIRATYNGTVTFADDLQCFQVSR
jgi:ribonuclease BN (tRNA processing enzyme)